MVCCYCNSNETIMMSNGKHICYHCAEEKGLVTCLEKGIVIADTNFYCDKICNDCIYKGEEI